MKDFNYEIMERIAVLSKTEGQGYSYTTEINLISFNGNSPKYDIRKWRHVKGYEPEMLKGIALDEKEFEALKTALR